jgi:hypothetical protein
MVGLGYGVTLAEGSTIIYVSSIPSKEHVETVRARLEAEADERGRRSCPPPTHIHTRVSRNHTPSDTSNDQNLWMSLGEAARVGAPSRG